MTVGGIVCGDFAVDQFGRKRWQSTNVTFRKTVVDRADSVT
jgi:hypothetical protein